MKRIKKTGANKIHTVEELKDYEKEVEKIRKIYSNINRVLEKQLESADRYATKLNINDAFYFFIKTWEHEISTVKFYAAILFVVSLLSGIGFLLCVIFNKNDITIGAAILSVLVIIAFDLEMWKYRSIFKEYKENRLKFVEERSLYFNSKDKSADMLNKYNISNKKIYAFIDRINNNLFWIYSVIYIVAVIALYFIIRDFDFFDCSFYQNCWWYNK